LPVVEFMRAVAATGYAGPLSLEIFNDQFRGGSPTTIAADGHRSLVYLMDQVARAEPAIALAAPAMPPRIEVSGVEFIEFTADEAGAAELATLLTALGFARAGRHRSKAVTLYRQGGINIVVNTEATGLARSSFVAHGTSAYAIGLKVADAKATVARAGALGAQMFAQPVAEGELTIPAIRGVGGGLIYFLDEQSELARVWDIEFSREPDADTPAAGLVSIDHVAQTMNYDEMLTWVLFYRSIFATKKSPMVDVLDPGGLVRSQVIENAAGTLRLTLNGADTARTFAGRFVSSSSGSGIQHLAFATSDIFATAEAAARNGLAPLAISSNYYEDLEARLGLDPELVTRLRRFNILYDRDEGGEFFQFYSPVIGAGFFIEVLERRRMYAGYGAPNAPFRIAAQRRAQRPTSAEVA
jgi:4-hydroxyphenylpyruvate dioxygenase